MEPYLLKNEKSCINNDKFWDIFLKDEILYSYDRRFVEEYWKGMDNSIKKNTKLINIEKVERWLFRILLRIE